MKGDFSTKKGIGFSDYAEKHTQKYKDDILNLLRGFIIKGEYSINSFVRNIINIYNMIV